LVSSAPTTLTTRVALFRHRGARMTNNYSEIASQPSFEVRISEGDFERAESGRTGLIE
jgi:hypothetical protein